MRDKHPEIAWGVKVDTDYNSVTSFMWRSDQTSQSLKFDLNGIVFSVFAFKDKRDEQKF